MRGFLQQIIDAYANWTAVWMSMVMRSKSSRHVEKRPRSDADIVLSDFATVISDPGKASERVVGRHSGERMP